MAVGVGLKTEKIANFFDSMNKEISRQIDTSDLESSISYDGEITLTELTPEFFEYLGKLSPFGHSNPRPVFRFNDVQIVRCSATCGGSHTRGIMRQGNTSIDFIAFNQNAANFLAGNCDVLATPQLNNHQGMEQPQLSIVDIHSY